MKRRESLLALALAALLVLAGCAGGDEGNDGVDSGASDNGDPGASDPNGTGDGAGDLGDPAEVDDLAVPLAPGADAVADVDSGPNRIVQYIVPLSAFDQTITFYDDWTAGRSGAYQRTEADSGGVTWQNDPDLGGDKTIIAVLSPLEGDDFLTVTITAGPAE